MGWGGFLNIKEIGRILSLDKPIVWRLSDMWPFTGGCHYSNGCEKYMSKCVRCPQLDYSAKFDLAKSIFKKKLKRFDTKNLTVVAPSKWIAQSAAKSFLFKTARIEIIPTGVDIKIFKPIDKDIARELLNLPKDKTLILSGAIGGFKNKRKGGEFLLDALRIIEKDRKDIDLVHFGSELVPYQFKKIKTWPQGHVSDDLILAIIYSACDVFVAPSVEENLANTVLESISCGTPVVCFDIGGMPDAILHLKNGYLAKPFDVKDLSEGISWIINNDNKNELKRTARQVAESKFSNEKSTIKYIELYRNLISKNSS